jgi:hypothetical protein
MAEFTVELIDAVVVVAAVVTKIQMGMPPPSHC